MNLELPDGFLIHTVAIDGAAPQPLVVGENGRIGDIPKKNVVLTFSADPTRFIAFHLGSGSRKLTGQLRPVHSNARKVIWPVPEPDGTLSWEAQLADGKSKPRFKRYFPTLWIMGLGEGQRVILYQAELSLEKGVILSFSTRDETEWTLGNVATPKISVTDKIWKSCIVQLMMLLQSNPEARAHMEKLRRDNEKKQ